MKINKKLIFILLIIYTTVLFISFKLIDFHTNKEIEYIVDQYNIHLKSQYTSMMYHLNKSSDTTVEVLKRFANGKVIDIFDKASKTEDVTKLNSLREQLKELLTTKYNMMKQRGILQLHFVFPNNITFLRMHKPDKFGDDLSDIRKDFYYANDYKRIIRGFSHGKTSHGFRNIYPIYNTQNEYIGLIDISYPSELIQDTLVNIDNTHTLIF